MAINLKLGPVTQIGPAEDDMSRTWVGFSPTHSDQTTFDTNRGLWVLGPRAERERYATFSADGVIRVVAEIANIQTVPAKVAGARAERSVVGRVLGAGHPVHDAPIGTQVDRHRNPVTYIEDPDGGPRTCACGCGCGCGGSVPAHRAVPARARPARRARAHHPPVGQQPWVHRLVRPHLPPCRLTGRQDTR